MIRGILFDYDGTIAETEERYGDKFYSAVQVDIPIFTPEECPKCAAGETVIDWREVVG